MVRPRLLPADRHTGNRQWLRRLLVILALSILLSGAAAAEVTLSVPERDYYALPGESAIIPLTIASTYGHDITGSLKQVMVPANNGTSGSGSATMQSSDLAAFTEQRSVSISTARSDIPGDYLLTLLFSYQEAGARSVVLDGIRIHVVTTPDDNRQELHEPLTGTDIPNPSAAPLSAGNSRTPETASVTPSATPAVSEEAQDTSALKEQLARESNETRDLREELERVIMADPLVAGRDRSLRSAGFIPSGTRITPLAGNSATFVLTYSLGTRTATIRGDFGNSHVLFAEESADGAVPVPDALAANATYREYGNWTSDNGFVRAGTWINVTTGWETVNLTYTNTAGRAVRFNAQINAGTVVSAEGESMEDPLPPFLPGLSLAALLAISAGIWYLSRTHRADPPVQVQIATVPELPESSRILAFRILDEAEKDAAGGSWPEAYRKAGRALRIFVSHEAGHGKETTSDEADLLARTAMGSGTAIRGILERCRIVGFAKGSVDPEEFRQMVRDIRALLEGKEQL